MEPNSSENIEIINRNLNLLVITTDMRFRNFKSSYKRFLEEILRLIEKSPDKVINKLKSKIKSLD